jgi:hypothetical protein
MEISNFWKLEADKMKVSDVEIVKIKELIKTIKPIRFEKYKTSDILHNFFESKVKREGHSVENGEKITYDILQPDMTVHDHYVIVLYDYFHNLYEDKTGETISLAYAYEYIIQKYNRLEESQFGNPQPLPNTNLNDIETAIKLENEQTAEVVYIDFNKEFQKRKDILAKIDFIRNLIDVFKVKQEITSIVENNIHTLVNIMDETKPELISYCITESRFGETEHHPIHVLYYSCDGFINAYPNINIRLDLDIHNPIACILSLYAGCREWERIIIDYYYRNINKEKHQKNVDKAKKQLRFDKRLCEDETKEIYSLLIERNFIKDNIREESFLYWFGYDTKFQEIDPITWIKKNKNTGMPSKISLLDLLVLMGYKEEEIRKNINTAFIVDGGKKFGSANYTDYKDWSKIKSEYHAELEEIINKSKK